MNLRVNHVSLLVGSFLLDSSPISFSSLSQAGVFLILHLLCAVVFVVWVLFFLRYLSNFTIRLALVYKMLPPDLIRTRDEMIQMIRHHL